MLVIALIIDKGEVHRDRQLRIVEEQLGSERARIVKAGKAIRAAQANWPAHAVEHVERVLEAVRALGAVK